MMDDGGIMQCIVKRDIKDLCFRVCHMYINQKNKSVSLFFNLYSLHFSHTANQTFLEAIIQRLKMLGNSDVDEAKIVVELYLLLYNGQPKYQELYKVRKSSHAIDDLRVLIMDDANLSMCKDICNSYLKNGKQTKVKFAKMPDQYQQDYIWLVWFEVLKLTYDIGKDIHEYCRFQFDIFTIKYNRKAAKERVNMIYNIIDAISESITSKQPFQLGKEPVIKMSFVEIMLKIDFIFQQLGHKPKISLKTFLNKCCLHCLPTVGEVCTVVEQNYIPESKTLCIQKSMEKIVIDDLKKMQIK